jgi:hypothetical protein
VYILIWKAATVCTASDLRTRCRFTCNCISILLNSCTRKVILIRSTKILDKGRFIVGLKTLIVGRDVNVLGSVMLRKFKDTLLWFC